MRLGIIALRWLPSFGGGEQYVHRLACALSAAGVDSRAFTGTTAHEDLENGEFPVTRVDAGIRRLEPASTIDWNPEGGEHFLRFRAWAEHAVRWAGEQKLTHVLLNQPLTHVPFFYALELYQQLQAAGILVGAIHHDLGEPTRVALVEAFRETASWERAREIVRTRLEEAIAREGEIAASWKFDCPLYFRPDFLVPVSDWGASLANPGESIPAFVLHPRLPAPRPVGPATTEPLERKTLLMVNPVRSKGVRRMLGIVANRPPDWSIRILGGGHGRRLPGFARRFRSLPEALRSNVEFINRVPDVRAAYVAADAVVVPSRYEGYGLVAVEAMQAGTPVVTSEYPAIREAVGEGAKCLCPFFAKKGQWLEAIRELLEHRETWVERAAARTAELEQRQDDELTAFVTFLEKL